MKFHKHLIPGSFSSNLPDVSSRHIGQMFDYDLDDEKIGQAIQLIGSVHSVSIETEKKIWVRRGVVESDSDADGAYTGNAETGMAVGITIRSDTSDPVYAFLHEVGHYIDHRLLIPLGEFTSTSEHILDAVKTWRKAVENTRRYQEIKIEEQRLITLLQTIGLTDIEKSQLKVNQYRLQIRELFARTYAQYIVVRTHEEWAHSLVLDRLKDKEKKFMVWELDDFEPVAKALDELFLRRGWIKPANT